MAMKFITMRELRNQTSQVISGNLGFIGTGTETLPATPTPVFVGGFFCVGEN